MNAKGHDKTDNGSGTAYLHDESGPTIAQSQASENGYNVSDNDRDAIAVERLSGAEKQIC